MPILYYLIIKPLSLLPFWVLYRISDLLYVVLYYLIGYRRRVIEGNISSTLIHLTTDEQQDVVRRFYKHFCDVIVESVKLFSISDKALRQRMDMSGADEAFRPFYERGQSVLVVSGHYNNWEYFATLCNALVPHRGYGIYTPIQNAFMSTKIQASRGRYGVVLLAKKEVKDFFTAPGEGGPFAVFFGADQSPSLGRKAYEMTFLNRKTRVQFGLEKYATQYNLPVVFFHIEKVKRGYYRAHFQVLQEEPASTTYGRLTELHTKALERVILKEPAYWLWSHKRWKGMDYPQPSLT